MSNSDRVRAFIDAFNRKDIDAVVVAFTDDAVYHNMMVAPLVGRAAIQASIAGYTSPASQIDWVMCAVAETADGKVLTERIDRFHIGGKWIELPVMGTFEFVDGRISAWRDYFDMNQFTSQMPGTPA